MSSEQHEVRIADHPRAVRQIESFRGGAAIAAFFLTALLSHRAGLPVFDAGVRALGAGVATFVVAWALAVMVWRQLAVAELNAARRAATARRQASGAPRRRA